MNMVYRPADTEALRLAAELTGRGLTVELERHPDGSLECVEIIRQFSPETQAAIDGKELTEVSDFRAWINTLD